ncbi:hypothetical protein COBT_004200, partial [Conglomerata obtusa]
QNFDESVSISKLVISGDERAKLAASCVALGIDVAILGPDSRISGVERVFLDCWDDFLIDKIGMTVVRVSKNELDE